MSALQTVRETEGLTDYLNAVERRLADVVHAHPGEGQRGIEPHGVVR